MFGHKTTNSAALAHWVSGREETRHIRKEFLRWVAESSIAVAVGLIIGPRINSSRNPWLSLALSTAFLLLTILWCNFELPQLRHSTTNVGILRFSIPIGLGGALIIVILKVLGPSFLSVPETDVLGIKCAMVALYVAALIWVIMLPKSPNKRP